MTLGCGKVWQVLDQVMDPEVPVISVVDLGIVREVSEKGENLKIVITPTYSGCPATMQIETDICVALKEAGFHSAALETRLSPAWTSDWISEKGRRALTEFGIAPPVGNTGKQSMFGAEPSVPCPHCGSQETKMVSEFGSTACKALWMCQGCKEPFDYFKCI